MKTVELLAPVGKIENAYAAIENGADALFVGGKFFNARQYADNFTNDELEKIVDYAKLRAVKVYVTVNTLVKEQEIKSVFYYLSQLSALGIDAVISQDLAIVALIKNYFPQIPLHASTQMTAHSVQDVLFLKQLGFKRVVLARELRLSDVKAIVQASDIEIETFIHGALCYSYSGQCLMSSLIGGRSGNRGRCAQPCRMKYCLTEDNEKCSEEGYLLSLKDICTLDFLPELIHAGIHSFKIEGRMKSPEYVASVVKTYKKYLNLIENNEPYRIDETDIELIKGVFNRGGFSKGYFFGTSKEQMFTKNSPKHIGLKAGAVTHFSPKINRATILLERDLYPGDGIEIIRAGYESVGTGISKHYSKGASIQLDFDKYIPVGSEVYLTKNHQLLKSLRSTYLKAARKIPIDLVIKAKVGESIFIEARYKDLKVVYSGDLLENALNMPLTKESAVKQLTKFGNTSFVVNSLIIDWDESGYIAVSKLNEMRRMIQLKLEEEILKRPDVLTTQYVPPKNQIEAKKRSWTANVMTFEQLKACIDEPEISAVYWEWQYNNALAEEAHRLCCKANKSFYLALPYVVKNSACKKISQMLDYWESTDISGYLIRTYGTFYMLKNSSKNKNIDYNLNIMNNEAIALWSQYSAAGLTVSVETSHQELQRLQGSLERIIYGHLPVMTSEQCILKSQNKCKRMQDKQSDYLLCDRKDVLWHIQTDCEACVMQLMTDKPLTIKQFDELSNPAAQRLRFNFSFESGQKTKKILKAYIEEDIAQIKLINGVSFKPID